MAIGGLCVSRDLCGQMKNSSNRVWLPHSLWSLSVTTCSVAKSCPSLQSHGPQHTRPPCPSPTPGVYSNSCPLSQWCHPTISSSVVPFSSRLQSFPASGSLPMSQFFASGGQSIGVSASTSVLPMTTQDWFPLGWTGWISLLSKGLSRVLSNTTVQKHQFFSQTIALTRRTFVSKVMSLLFNTHSGFVIAFLSRSKSLLISWLQSLFVVILEPKKIKVPCRFSRKNSVSGTPLGAPWLRLLASTAGGSCSICGWGTPLSMHQTWPPQFFFFLKLDEKNFHDEQ